ncbi:hypothetical protein H2200_003628 [Cladophialophora chaetospira]|uniref:NAD(P)-binding domain-containing protein n=1 Tax=Cladophialophora chaetospira TaxID=386627 RepID=A0AA39CL98_9EURO|nr:hypothetical protein H2200_003628 [Cladophialophora chaetospira]
MHLFILGATGRTGVLALRYALEQGHNVTVLVRNQAAVETHPNLTIIEGSVLCKTDIDRAFTAAGTPVDAALQFLNSPRASDGPWAKWHGPARLIADSTALVTEALRNQQRPHGAPKPRLVVLSALGAGESRKVAGYFVRFMTDHTNVGYTYEDHNAVDAEIEGNCADKVAWTSAMAVFFSGAGVKPVKTFTATGTGFSMFITRESTARWMVDVACGKFGDEFANQRVVMSN